MAKPTATKGRGEEEVVRRTAPTKTNEKDAGGGVPGMIHVPEEMGGGDLRLLEGIARASLQKVLLGTSKANQPKATVKFILTEDMDGIKDGEPSTIGEPVLESFSLQPQAMWKINDLYKAVMGANIEHKDYTPQEFAAMLNEALTGTEWDLVLEIQTNRDGKPQTVVTKRSLA